MFQTAVHLDSKLPYGVEAGVSRSRGQQASLPYIILDNHISETEGLHLLGRIVRNVRRPLECYVPSGTSMCAPSSHTLHAGSTTEPSSSHSTSHSAPWNTAQDTYPNYDPALFVLPYLPLSVSESTSVTLSERDNYSSQTQSLLSSLLGVSFSMRRTASKAFTLNANIVRILSLNQHSDVFSRLVRLYGKEIRGALKITGGTMYFVVGVKLATDATVETRREGKRSVAGKVEVNATQVTGLGTQGTSGIELGQVLGGRNVQNEFEGTTTEEIKGERAFAVGYYSVQLRREVGFRRVRPCSLRDPASPPREDTLSLTNLPRPRACLRRGPSLQEEDQSPLTSRHHSRRYRNFGRGISRRRSCSPETDGTSSEARYRPPALPQMENQPPPTTPHRYECSHSPRYDNFGCRIPNRRSRSPETYGASSEACYRFPALPQREDQQPPLNNHYECSDSHHPLTYSTPSETWPLREEFRGPASAPREEIGGSRFFFHGEDFNMFEVVLGDELYIETFDCLG